MLLSVCLAGHLQAFLLRSRLSLYEELAQLL